MKGAHSPESSKVTCRRVQLCMHQIITSCLMRTKYANFIRPYPKYEYKLPLAPSVINNSIMN